MYEKDVLKEMLYEAMIIGDDIAYIDMYNKYKVKYDFIKNYSLLIGTNELQHSNFYKSIIGQIHTKKYFDSFTKDGKKIYLVNPLSDYKNLLYISEDFKKEPYVDHTIFLDNQAVNMFVRFFDKKIQNDFVDTQIKYGLDLNYLLYVLEDYVNPHHRNFKPNMTFEKIYKLDVINHLNKEVFNNTGEILIDIKRIQSHGFQTVDMLVEDRKSYCTHFIDQHKYNLQLQTQIINESTVKYYFDENFKEVDINQVLGDYYLIFGFVIKIIIENWKNISIENKLNNLYDSMVTKGRVFKHLLEFAYRYFNNNHIYSDFFKYDKKMTYDNIIQLTHNISWDIFLYSISLHFISSPRKRFENIQADFGIGQFVTKDTPLFKSYISGYDRKIFLIKKSKIGNTHDVINSPSSTTEKVEVILNEYNMQNIKKIQILKNKNFNLFKKYPYQIALLFCEQMKSELKLNYL